jgi:hypothetical protein
MRGRWRALGAVWLVLGGSCAGENVPPAGPPDAGQSRFARVRVEVSLPRDGEPTVTTEARFLRVTDLDLEAAQVLAGATSLPAELLPPGRCVRTSAERLVDDALASASPDAQVTLLDAGDLVVQAGGRPDRLTPRFVPEIVPFVTGVWYDSETDPTQAAPLYLDDDASVQVTGFGGHDVGRFDTEVRLPHAPVVTRVGGVDPAEVPAVIDRGADLEIHWATAPRGDDTIVVSLGWSRGELIRCRADEATRIVIKRELLAEALRGVDAANLSIAVETSRRAPWSAAGLDAADLIVSVRDVVTARLP